MTGCQKGHLLKCPGASTWETSETTFSTSAHAAGDSRQSFAVYVCPWKRAGRHCFVHRGCGQCAVPRIMKQKLRQANTLLGGTVEELQFMPFLAQIRYCLEASISSSSSSSTYFGQIHFSSSVGPAWVPLKSISCSGHWVKSCLIAWGFVWLSERWKQKALLASPKCLRKHPSELGDSTPQRLHLKSPFIPNWTKIPTAHGVDIPQMTV